MDSSGRLLEPRTWCRQSWCRQDEAAEHAPGDGCSCHAYGTALETETTPILLKPSAARLAAFACRACGRNERRMVEGPSMFFRCETCAAEGRWPMLRSRG